MAMSTPYIGSRISLISKNDVRYEGILYAIDANQSEVYLQNVRCFGTEDRNKENVVPPTSDVYGCIIFPGSDIKDLHVCFQDDSMMQGMPYGGYGRGYMMPQYGSYPYGNPYAQYNPYYGFDQIPPGMDQNFPMQPLGHYPNVHGGYDLAPQAAPLDESFSPANETTSPEIIDLHSSTSQDSVPTETVPSAKDRQEALSAPATATDSKAAPSTFTPESATNLPTQPVVSTQPAPSSVPASNPSTQPVPSSSTPVSAPESQLSNVSATRPDSNQQRKSHGPTHGSTHGGHGVPYQSHQAHGGASHGGSQKKFIPSGGNRGGAGSQVSHQEHKPRDTRVPQGVPNDNRQGQGQGQDQKGSSGRGRGSNIRGKGNYNRSRNRRVTGQFTGPDSPQAVFDEDFDFESSLAKFDKEKFTAQLGEPASEETASVPVPPAYEKSMFFDNISCESNERDERDHRSLQNQRKLDSETFGNLALDDNKNRRGGRGRRPYSNRNNNSRPSRGTGNQTGTPHNNSRGGHSNNYKKRTDDVPKPPRTNNTSQPNA